MTYFSSTSLSGLWFFFCKIIAKSAQILHDTQETFGCTLEQIFVPGRHSLTDQQYYFGAHLPNSGGGFLHIEQTHPQVVEMHILTAISFDLLNQTYYK